MSEKEIVKVLNLYCGIGGNRKLWPDHYKVTAVEYIPEIARAYADQFPDDDVIVGDAHEYLLKHFHEFDIIWASPPCPTHSKARRASIHSRNIPKVPDLNQLYGQIIFLKEFAPDDLLWIYENVEPYYPPLIKPTKRLGRHLFWANFEISDYESRTKYPKPMPDMKLKDFEKMWNISLDDYKFERKDRIFRNCVEPELGKHILEEAEATRQGRSSKIVRKDLDEWFA